MIDISVQGIKKAFDEGVDILSGVTFDVNEGEHIGLLGKNGAGKTTLFRLITGELTADEGEIVLPSYKKTGLISQIPVYPDGYTVDDVLKTAFSRIYSLKSEMTALESEMTENSSQEILKKYDASAYEYERLGGYNTGFELNRVTAGLRIPESQRAQPFSLLSGGEKTRVNLARLILENTDILLLDEPTNHLDMRATEWLEEFLQKYKGTVVAISHDRYFLDRTINRAIEISNGKAEFYSGNYSYYVKEKERRYLEQLEKYEREQAEAKRLQESADRLRQWGTGNKKLMKKSFAIEKRIERLVKTDRPKSSKSMRVKFGENEFRGDEALIVKGLKKSYDGKELFDIPELEVRGGERIALIGDNGTGKTTLIKLIMGEETPDAGFARKGPSVKPAYLPQIVKFANPRMSVLDTLMNEGKLGVQEARNRLGAFMFSGEDVFKLVGDLSGGEKSRLRLCILMNGEINLLILDEPTNHLDAASREWMEKAVEQYGESLLFISHDRYFIDRLATRVWELENGALHDFRGTFSEYREHKNSLQKTEPVKKEVLVKVREKRKPAVTKKELNRAEREIEKLEAELSELAGQRIEFASDYMKLMELDEIENQINNALDEQYKLWEEFSDT